MATDCKTKCACPSDATGPWDCIECPVHGERAAKECEAEHRAEMQAENAWLRAAEYDPEAEAFAAWEASRGLL